VLVNDNATATLASVAEASFTSINASDTVSTTSFGGYVSAGTNVSVTPHISEGDHLMVNYSLSLSSFGEGGTASIPPPRQTNDISSEVTIPDGYTVVVGGLTRKDKSESESHIPFLGDIPLLKYLFGTTTRSHSETTLYVFIRPVILRDDRFEDLKYLSEGDCRTAELPPEFPTSQPIVMR
jgi:general secretion pathway protein D